MKDTLQTVFLGLFLFGLLALGAVGLAVIRSDLLAQCNDDDLRAADRDRLEAVEEKAEAHEKALAEHVKAINQIVAEIQKMRQPKVPPVPEKPLPKEDLESQPDVQQPE